MEQDAWNSLEIFKAVMSVLTPLIVVLFGYLINKNLQLLEQKQWENRTLTEWRLRVFDDVTPGLYDIYSYMLRINNWKHVTPPEIIQTKRFLDKKINTSAALFSTDLMGQYHAFAQLCFHSYRSWEQEAAINISANDYRRYSIAEWQTDWEDCFAGDHVSPNVWLVEQAYKQLMELLSKELNISLKGEHHHEFRPRILDDEDYWNQDDFRESA